MPTTMLITTVNTLLSTAISAMGISLPYGDIAPYFESITLHSTDITKYTAQMTSETV